MVRNMYALAMFVASATTCLFDSAHAASCPSSKCKAYPGTANWPSADTWKALNTTVGGRLFRPTPPAAVCHQDQPSYNETQCQVLTNAWHTYEFHVADPVSVMWDQYTNATCLPNSKAPCSATGYPAYVVNVTSAQEIKAAIDFARTNNVRLNVKSTGHDYMGRSNAPGTLSIWTHHLNDLKYHSGEFKLASGRVLTGNAMTVGSAAMMWDMYREAAKHNQTVVGGGGKTVSAAGYISGGGHSVLAPRYGLAADNVLEMQVVTPAGKIVTVNQDQNQDLFWALRGGGGSTFGVVTSITMKTHPSPKITSYTWAVFTDPAAPFAKEMVGLVMSQAPQIMDAGVSGYNYVSLNMTNPQPTPGAPTNVAGIFGVILLQDNSDPAALEKILKPLNDMIHAKWGNLVSGIHAFPKQYDSFLAWYSENFDQDRPGANVYLASRLLGKQAFGDYKALGEAVAAASKPNGGMSYFYVAGKGVQEAKPAGGSNAVHPAWRKAYVHALSSISFPAFNKTAEKSAIATLDEAFTPFRKLTPSSGTYINEALPFEKDPHRAFWGDNYARLLKVKRQVDPNDVFWCTPCVGNERWQVKENGQLCRAP